MTGSPQSYMYQGWTGKPFFSRGGAGKESKFVERGGPGRGTPPLPAGRGGAGNPSLPAGRGDHPCYRIYLSENFPEYMVRAQRIGFFNIGSGWVLEKIPGSGSASDWVGVLK